MLFNHKMWCFNDQLIKLKLRYFVEFENIVTSLREMLLYYHFDNIIELFVVIVF